MDKVEAAHLAMAVVVAEIREEVAPLIELTKTMMAYTWAMYEM